MSTLDLVADCIDAEVVFDGRIDGPSGHSTALSEENLDENLILVVGIGEHLNEQIPIVQVPEGAEEYLEGHVGAVDDDFSILQTVCTYEEYYFSLTGKNPFFKKKKRKKSSAARALEMLYTASSNAQVHTQALIDPVVESPIAHMSLRQVTFQNASLIIHIDIDDSFNDIICQDADIGRSRRATSQCVSDIPYNASNTYLEHSKIYYDAIRQSRFRFYVKGEYNQDFRGAVDLRTTTLMTKTHEVYTAVSEYTPCESWKHLSDADCYTKPFKLTNTHGTKVQKGPRSLNSSDASMFKGLLKSDPHPNQPTRFLIFSPPGCGKSSYIYFGRSVGRPFFEFSQLYKTMKSKNNLMKIIQHGFK